VFPLGCGICRSERLEVLQKRNVRQAVTSENVPKAWLYQNRNKKADKIIRPLIEVEVPQWFYRYEEILEELIAAREVKLNNRQIYKLRRKAARKYREEIEAAM